MWLCLGPWARIRAGDPTVAPLPTNALTLLPAPVVPRNALGIQGRHPPSGLPRAGQGAWRPPSPGARMNALWTCRRLTWEEMGGT